MTAHAVPSGTFTFSGTLAASTPDSVTFADRAGFVALTNTGTAVLYARADGQTATIAGNGCVAVMPGETGLVGNGEPLWYQSADVIPQGANQFGGGNTDHEPVEPRHGPVPALAGRTDGESRRGSQLDFYGG